MLEFLDHISFTAFDKETNKRMLEICFPDAKCNMNCKYCYGNHKTRPCNNSRPLNKEALRKLILPLKDSISFVHLWGGEILYNKEFFMDAVSFIEEILPGIQINLVTNGLLLPEWVDYLIEHHIDIAISHDGPGQKYRGMDFLKSEKHVNAILKMYKANLFKTFKVVIHSKNFSYEKIIKYFSDFNKRYNIEARIEGLLIQSNDTEAYIFKPEDFPAFEKEVIWMTRDIVSHIDDTEYLKLRYSITQVYTVINAIDLVANKPLTMEPSPCQGTQAYSFTSDGKRVPCHCFVEKDSNIQDLELNIKEFFKECMNCEVRSLCNGGCLAKSLQNKEATCSFSYFYYNTILNTIRAMIEELQNG